MIVFLNTRVVKYSFSKMSGTGQVVEYAVYYKSCQTDSTVKLDQAGKMHGARRVITFCLLTAVLPTILLITPLYLRHSVFADVTFAVAESDVVEIVDGISTIFCQAQSLKMNTSFHSFQLGSLPERSGKRKHLHLKKSMVIPDDTLEYWGFFLPKGSTVILSACSRYVGSRLLVVKGEKNLRTCGLMDQNEEEVLAHMASNHGQVRITFETQAQEIHEGHKLSFTNKHSLTLGDYPKISSTLSPLQDDSTPRAQYSGFKSSTKTLKEKQETHKDAEAVSYIDENTAYEQDDDDEYVNDSAMLTQLEQKAVNFINKHVLNNQTSLRKHTNTSVSSQQDNKRKLRHAKKRDQTSFNSSTRINTNSNNRKLKRRKELIKQLEQLFNEDAGEIRLKSQKKNETNENRQKRDANMGHVLDAGIGHGGNAVIVNVTTMPDEEKEESDVSSFENDLLTCYDGNILLHNPFLPSVNCTGQHMLEDNQQKTFETTHNVLADGYYYYIFYSDNDFVLNDVHATFDIFKPTYQYANFTKGCVNQTQCTFPITFLSNEIVIVEVPTRDGIEHEEDDITYLISSCHPRMSVYIIFPVTVLFLILGCAFL